jgi:hypothetical protein
MTRYFFDFHDGDEARFDTEGTELPDMQAARDEATRTLLSLAKEEFPAHGRARELSVRIRSEEEGHLLAIAISYSEEPPHWVR